MKAFNFAYDGVYLSDFGCIICSFDSPGLETLSIGSNITFNKTPVLNGKYHPLVSTAYEDCYEADIQICKNPKCIIDGCDRYFTIDEQREIARWLNRNDFCKFSIFDCDEEDEPYYYNGSFNVEKIVLAGNVIGFQLHFTTSSPFAFCAEKIQRFDLASPNLSVRLNDCSDEIGYVYPEVTIECKSSGDLHIKNSMDKQETVIKNCVSGEIITIKDMIIESSSSAHQNNLMNDFNFRYPKIINTYQQRLNVYTFSFPCKGTFKYNPIRKVGI